MKVTWYYNKLPYMFNRSEREVHLRVIESRILTSLFEHIRMCSTHNQSTEKIL